ncbi:hypothetical protein ACQUY5_25710 [Bacillus cereus]|uniref:hypothetical protein n=1 Tax=Bacillus cereus TaxID=1396 RepID=UPI003D186033
MGKETGFYFFDNLKPEHLEGLKGTGKDFNDVTGRIVQIQQTEDISIQDAGEKVKAEFKGKADAIVDLFVEGVMQGLK